MPVYEYECSHCGAVFELLRSVNSKPPRKCPECGETGGVTKRVSAPAFQFKGSGWYVTDYAGKGKGKGKAKGGDEPAAADSGKESKSSDDAKPKAEKSDKPKAKAKD